MFDAGGLSGYEPRTGQELWHYPWETVYDMNMIQPLVVGYDRVFISSELENGGAMLRVKPPGTDASPWSVETVWKNKKLAARFANPVTDGKHIFGLHNVEGILTCLDAETGTRKWAGDRYGCGQMLLAGDGLLVVSDKGVISLVATHPTQFNELARYP